jgi:hypothetical protein
MRTESRIVGYYEEVVDFSITFMMRGPLSAGFHPYRAPGAELPLPDGGSRLDRLDSGTAGREGLGPVGSGRRDGDRDVAYRQHANSMAEKDLCFRMGGSQLRGDPGQLPFGHRDVGLVFEPLDGAALVVVPHDSHEERQAAVAVPAHGLEEGARLEGLVGEESHRNMIRPGARFQR